MENIPQNKLDFLTKMNMSVDVKKSKDVLGKDAVQTKDVMAGKQDTLINKMSDVFPQSNSDNDLLS